jgi:hypothetical protein
MRRAIVCGGVIAVSALGQTALAAPSPRTARITGRVRVCNTPDHCVTRVFHVSAVNANGRTVARTSTTGTDNRYRLRLRPGDYQLVAKSSGLVCKASATAVAHETERVDITCLVP